MRNFALLVPAVILVLAACTSNGETSAEQEPASVQPAKPAAPKNLKWGETANLAGARVVVKQPVYEGRERKEGPVVRYVLTVENDSSRVLNLFSSHAADGKELPLYETDTVAVEESSVSPGQSATFIQKITAVNEMESFKVHIGSGGEDSNGTVDAAWEGTVKGSAAAEVNEEPTAGSEPVQESPAHESSWPCEPGYPNCTKEDSEKYLANLEYLQCMNSGGQMNLQTQKCTYPPQTDAPSGPGIHSSDPNYRDANGETKAEYCARTGQPLETCEAG